MTDEQALGIPRQCSCSCSCTCLVHGERAGRAFAVIDARCHLRSSTISFTRFGSWCLLDDARRLWLGIGGWRVLAHMLLLDMSLILFFFFFCILSLFFFLLLHHPVSLSTRQNPFALVYDFVAIFPFVRYLYHLFTFLVWCFVCISGGGGAGLKQVRGYTTPAHFTLAYWNDPELTCFDVSLNS
ncbi:hypothetical protein V8C44DRAFT_306751 [Trichoderma aethiopicum]